MTEVPTPSARRTSKGRRYILGLDLSMFTRLDQLGLVVVGQRLEPDRAVLARRVSEPDEWCGRCGCEGFPRDNLVRRVAHDCSGGA